MFIGKLLPAHPGNGPLAINRPDESPPPLWDEAVNYRYRLCLWRTLIFSGRIPVSPYDAYRDSNHRAFFPEQYVTLFDSAHAILRALRRLESNPSAPDSNGRSIAHVSENNIKMAENIYNLLTADEEFTGENVLKAAISSQLEKDRVRDRIHEATVLCQRSIWYNYTLSFFQNTLVCRNSDFNSALVKLIGMIRSFFSYLHGAAHLGQAADSRNISPALNQSCLPQMVIQLAVLSIKSSRPEVIWPLKDGTCGSDVLNRHQSFVEGVYPVLMDFVRLTSEKDGAFSSILRNFYSLWNSIFFPLLDNRSVLKMFLESHSLFIAGIAPGILPEDERQGSIDRVIIISGKLFEQIKNGIERDGGASCSYEPHLTLLREVIDLRWPLLRRRDRNAKLLAECLWVQKTFDHNIEELANRKFEGSTRARIYASAAVNVGHVYLKQIDAKAYESQRVYLLKAQSVVVHSNGDVMALVGIVMRRDPLN